MLLKSTERLLILLPSIRCLSMVSASSFTRESSIHTAFPSQAYG